MARYLMDDPPPEDGELGYTAPLEGGATELPDYYEPAPGQVTLLELIAERDAPISQVDELNLRGVEERYR